MSGRSRPHSAARDPDANECRSDRNALAARKEIAAARSPLFSTLGDATSGIVTIRAFGRENYFVSRYKTQTDRYNQVNSLPFHRAVIRKLTRSSPFLGSTVW
jgi:hypothetical protein